MDEAGRFDLSTFDGFPAFWHSLSSWIGGFRSRYTHLQSLVLEELLTQYLSHDVMKPLLMSLSV